MGSSESGPEVAGGSADIRHRPPCGKKVSLMIGEPGSGEPGRRGPYARWPAAITSNPARCGLDGRAGPGLGRWPLAPAPAQARRLRWKPRFWGSVMNIAYYHASKFGNGAMVAGEFKKIMAARGVTVSVEHIRDANP